MKPFGYALLLAATVRHYGWALVPPGMAGPVSKMLGALFALFLLYTLWRGMQDKQMLPVFAWVAFEETQTAVLSGMYAISPWPVALGQSLGDALLGFDPGAVGLFVIAVITFCKPVKSDTYK